MTAEQSEIRNPQPRAPAAPRSPHVATTRRAPRIALALACVVLAVGSFSLFSAYHDVQPYRYHPDEQGKVDQVLRDHRNFKHPLLMLETAALLQRMLGVSEDPQAVAQVGRQTSAAFAAGAVVMLALTGYLLRGGPGFVGVGLATGLSYTLLVFAHDFKEDAALTFGLAAFVAAAVWYGQRRSLLAALGAGAAAGLALSGKYVGIIAPAALVPLLILPGRQGRWWQRLAAPPLALAACTLVVLAINHRVLGQWDEFLRGMGAEARHGVSDHMGLAAPFPNLYWPLAVWRDLSWPVAVLAGVGLWACAWPVARRTGGRRGAWIVPAFALTYLLMLLWCPITFNRYALPVVVLVHALAGLGVAALWREKTVNGQPVPAGVGSAPPPRRAAIVWLRRAAGLLALALLVVVQGRLCADTLEQIRADSRFALEAFVRANVPAGARLMQDFYAGLPNGPLPRADGKGSIDVQGQGLFAADAGPLDRLRERRIGYVAVSDISYGRFFSPHLHPVASEEHRYAQRRAFYAELFEQGELLWQSPPARPTGAYVNPTLRLYRIAKRPSPAAR